MPRLPYCGYYEQRHSCREKTLNKGANKQTIQQYATVFVEGTDKEESPDTTEARAQSLDPPILLWWCFELCCFFPP